MNLKNDSQDKDSAKKTALEEEPSSEEVSAQTPTEDDKVPALEAEVKKAKDDLLYLMAEFDNYKKQAIKERSDLIKFGSERLIRELLGIVDIFRQALDSDVNSDSMAGFKKGMELTASELDNVLEKFGVERVPSKGQPFDPAIHEALSSEETATVPVGHVAREFKPAYKLHGRLIRPAQVIVAKEPCRETEEPRDTKA